MSDHDQVPDAVPDAEPAALWRAIVEDAPIAISVLAPDGRILIGNARYVDLMGYTAADMAGMSVEDVTLPDDRPWTRSYLSRLVAGEIDHHTTDKVFVRKDGEHLRMRLAMTALRRDGACVAIVGVLIPEADRQPLADSWFRKVIQNINDTVTLIDADGTVLDTSGRYKRVMGYPNEFWESRSLFDVMLPEEAGRVLQMREDIIANPGELIHTTVRMRNADNGIEVLDVHAANLLADPEIGGILLTTRNITAERELVEQLSRRRDEAVAEAELRSRMVATVSHELRNPLHALQGMSELLATSDLPDEARRMAATLHRQLRDLTRVADDLLTTTRLELGSMTLEMSSVDVRALCHDVLDIASASVQPGVSMGVVVGLEVPAEVVSDPVRLRQVLANLVGNAVKFTERGAVTLAVSLPEPGRLVIRLSDTGSGIPADEVEHVFEPFRSATTAGGAAGAGLGLSIVRRIVGLLGGTIEVVSVAGSGSTFVVSLPIAAVPQAPPPVPGTTSTLAPASAPVAGSPLAVPDGRHVLVVEDDPVNQQLVRAQLQTLGVACVIVGTGEAGIEHLASPDGDEVAAVLMDYHLPGIDGVEAARRIRTAESGTGRHVPIIGVTASASLGDRASCLAAGMDDHVPKPVGMSELRDAIARAVAPPAIDRDVVDEQVLEVLVDELGDRSIVVGVVETFLGQLDLRVDHIIDAVATADAGAARHWAHTLSSSARMVGAPRLAEMGSGIEHGDATAEAFRSLATQVRAALTAWAAG